ncbi:MAG TPA: multidrug effflux MFS transporter [Pseudonocardia sp.]|nr:multidrug effflux MFS transporter [Pseudonocardia sp.]
MPVRLLPAPGRAPMAVWISVLALMSAIAPLATDMYLPTFPRLAAELGTSASGVQLTLTAFLVGLAVGQLAFGPLSDRWGRRRPLLAGTAACALATLACAVAPDVWTFVAARFVMGFAGGAGVVLSLAVVVDRSTGDRAARLLSVMMAIQGLAPIAAPLLGGALAVVVGWRGIFWVLTGLTSVMFLGVLAAIPETLSEERRGAGGIASMARDLGSVLGRRRYVGYALSFGLAFAALFAYISGSPFVLQGVIGLSQTQFTLTFAVNAVGLSVASLLNVRLLRRFSPRGLALGGQIALVTCSAALLLVVLAGAPRWPVLALLFAAVFSVGFVLGNGSALAIREVPDTAGTGSALLGVLQYGLGAAVSPLVGANPTTMAVLMLGAGALALGSYTLLTREPGRRTVTGADRSR